MGAVTFSPRNLVILTCGVVAACGGRPVVTVTPAPSAPETAVEQFLAAVRAGDFARMGELWGTERGPSTVWSPNPPDVRRRQLTIMQRLLRNDEYRIVGSEVSPTAPNRRTLSVELVRGTRRSVVPFTVVATRAGGWLIAEIGLDAAFPRANPRTAP